MFPNSLKKHLLAPLLSLSILSFHVNTKGLDALLRQVNSRHHHEALLSSGGGEQISYQAQPTGKL